MDTEKVLLIWPCTALRRSVVRGSGAGRPTLPVRRCGAVRCSEWLSRESLIRHASQAGTDGGAAVTPTHRTGQRAIRHTRRGLDGFRGSHAGTSTQNFLKT